ncbi:type II toxin-antitoxin system VapC family toxin [Euzebya sp.]|uniref:type II toxin-antitoxin system VapC family toxin n=1 Tax=Euzebya sp. TaxID=1971409 RepID=UPI0035169FEE
MIVLDAAALVDVVADRPSGEWVLAVLEDEEIHAPAHQPAEVLSALSRLARAGDVSHRGAADALDEAMGLPQELHPVDRQLSRRAYELGDRIRVLDGLYVALAERLGAALVTTDLRIARADPPCAVRHPADHGGQP